MKAAFMLEQKISISALSKTALILFVVSSMGCATNIKERVVRNSLLAGALGAAYGDTKPEFKSQHSVMYGASAALVAAIASVYYYDPDKQIDLSRKTTTQLRDEMADFENSNEGTSRKAILLKGQAVPGFERLPEQYRRMINPGQWTISEIDQWVDAGEGRVIHQDKMLELKPATLNPR